MTPERIKDIVDASEKYADVIGVPPSKQDAFKSAYVEARVTVNQQAEALYAQFRAEVEDLVVAYNPSAPGQAKKDADAMVEMLKRVAKEAYSVSKLIPRKAVRSIFIDALGSVFSIAVAGGLAQAEIDDEFRPEKVIEKAGHEKVDWES